MTFKLIAYFAVLALLYIAMITAYPKEEQDDPKLNSSDASQTKDVNKSIQTNITDSVKIRKESSGDEVTARQEKHDNSIQLPSNITDEDEIVKKQNESADIICDATKSTLRRQDKQLDEWCKSRSKVVDAA